MIFSRPLLGGALLLCAWVSGTAAASDDLIAVYKRALDGNPEYRSAVAGYQQAMEAKPQALAKLLPQVGVKGDASVISQTLSGRFFAGDLNPNGTDVNRSDGFNSVGYQVGLTQVLFDRGLYLTLDTAELEVSRAGLLTYDAQDALRIAVAEAYFGSLAADAALTFAEAERSAIASVLAQTRDKAANGLVAEAELELAQTQLDLAESALIAAKNGVSVARVQLELLTGGQPVGPLRGLPDSYLPPPPTPTDIAEWTRRALDQNLQLKAQKISTELARKGVSKAESLRLPKLDALAAYTYEFAEGGISNGIGAQNNRATDARVGIQLKLPIYAGGAISSGIRAAEAGLLRAEADEAAKRGEAQRKVQVAFLNATAGISRVQALRQAIESAKSSEQAARVGFEVGTRTNTDLLLAVRSRYRAERDFATGRIDVLLETLKLRAAAGSLSHADLLAVNGALR